MKSMFKGWWLTVIMLGLHLAGGAAGLLWSQKIFDPSQGPGGEPPFYFIRSDFVQGICLSVSVSFLYAEVICGSG